MSASEGAEQKNQEEVTAAAAKLKEKIEAKKNEEAKKIKEPKEYTPEYIGRAVDRIEEKQVEFLKAVETMNTVNDKRWSGTVGLQIIAFGGGIGGTLVVTSFALRSLNPTVIEWFGYGVMFAGVIYGVYVGKRRRKLNPDSNNNSVGEVAGV